MSLELQKYRKTNEVIRTAKIVGVSVGVTAAVLTFGLVPTLVGGGLYAGWRLIRRKKK